MNVPLSSKKIMRFETREWIRVPDGGYDSALHVFLALSFSNMPPEDRDFIIAEHRLSARQWFLSHPQEYLGLKKLGYALDKALCIESDKTILDTLEAQYVNLRTYLNRYGDQMNKANEDLCMFGKYQGDED
jgi:hypothetical protein